METHPLGQTWREIILGDGKSWVAFEHGTCVILMEPEPDLEHQAKTLLRAWGPVHPGSSSGDFGTIELPDGRGWVVTGHHNDILTYVGPDAIPAEGQTDVAIGLLGRARRGKDATGLVIVHVEDPRPRG